jgi:hypothetical protein
LKKSWIKKRRGRLESRQLDENFKSSPKVSKSRRVSFSIIRERKKERKRMAAYSYLHYLKEESNVFILAFSLSFVSLPILSYT